MRNIALIALFLWLCMGRPCQAQTVLFLDAGYNRLDALTWDRAVAHYRMARPWMESRPGFLTHGPHLKAGITRSLMPGLSVGIQLEGNIWRTRWENGPDEHLLQAVCSGIGLPFGFRPFFQSAGAVKGMEVNLVPKLGLWIQTMSKNGESIWDDADELGTSRITLAPGVGVGIAWEIPLGKDSRWAVRPSWNGSVFPRVRWEGLEAGLEGTGGWSDNHSATAWVQQWSVGVGYEIRNHSGNQGY